MNPTLLSHTLCFLAAALVAAPVAAQSDRDSNSGRSNNRNASSQENQSRESRQESRRQDSGQQQDRQRSRQMQNERSGAQSQWSDGQQSQNQRGQSNNQQQYRLEPAGWIYVAIDYDNDGYYDGGEWIFQYDLEEARDRSQHRSRDQQSQEANQHNQVRLQGEVVSLDTCEIPGESKESDCKCRFAELERESGKTTRVCLGIQENVSKLGVKKGDQLTVEGARGMMDDEEVVFAQRLYKDGKSVDVQPPEPAMWNRLSGEIIRLHDTEKGGRQQKHTVAKLKLEGDQGAEQVDLGPASELSDVDLKKGDTIRVLARERSIGGEPMLMAQLIRVNDSVIDVRGKTDASFNQGDQQRDQQASRQNGRDQQGPDSNR